MEQVKTLGATSLPWMPDESAFVMPFARGKATGDAQRMMALLHETGRITRQEAASMVPVRLVEEIGKVLALGDRVAFRDGARVVYVRPAERPAGAKSVGGR